MTAIAEQLDRRLKAMPPDRAACVTKLVHDLLEVVYAAPASPTETDRQAAIAAHRGPSGAHPEVSRFGG